MFDFEQQIVLWTLQGYVQSRTSNLGWTDRIELRLKKGTFSANIYYRIPFDGISGILEEKITATSNHGLPGVSLDKLLEVFS